MIDVDFQQALDQVQKMVNDLVTAVPAVLVALVVFVVFLLVANVTRIAIQLAMDRGRRRHNVALVVGRLVQWAIVIIGFLSGLVIVFPQFSAAELIQLLGLSSVAIGFAFRDVLQNLLVGLILLLNEPFVVGDQIISDDYEGTVEAIRSRATHLRTYDGRDIVIPNADLFNKGVTVITGNDKRRVEYDLRLGYADDIEAAKAVILDAVTSLEDKRILSGPPPDVLVMDLASYHVTLRLRWWISPTLHQIELATRDKVLVAVKAALLDAGMTIPLPAQRVLLHDQNDVAPRPYVVTRGEDGLTPE